ncbi:MAG: hypothetical protein WC966_02725 [Bradymonadales bacterium]|jgi:hypothetical protein
MRFWLILFLFLYCASSAWAQEKDGQISHSISAKNKKIAYPEIEPITHSPLHDDEKVIRYGGGLKLNSSYSGRVSPLRDERVTRQVRDTHYHFMLGKSSNVELYSPSTTFLIDLDSMDHSYDFYSRKQSYKIDRELYRVSYRKDVVMPFGRLRHVIGNAKHKVLGDVEQPTSFESARLREENFLISYSFDVKRFYLTLGYARSKQAYSNPYPMLSFSELRESLYERNLFFDFSYRLNQLQVGINYNNVRGYHDRRQRYDFKDHAAVFYLQYKEAPLQFEFRAGTHELNAALKLDIWQFQILSALERRVPSLEELYGKHEYLDGNPQLRPATRMRFGMGYQDNFDFPNAALNIKSQLSLVSDHDRIAPYPKTIYYYSYQNLASQQFLQYHLHGDFRHAVDGFSYQLQLDYAYRYTMHSSKPVFGLYQQDLRLFASVSWFKTFEFSAFYHYLSPTRVSYGVKTAAVHANAVMFSIVERRMRVYLLLRNLSDRSHYSKYLRPIKGFEAFIGLAYNKEAADFSEWDRDPSDTKFY